MDIDDVGDYKCEVSTTFETKEFTARIDIFGLGEFKRTELVYSVLILIQYE